MLLVTGQAFKLPPTLVDCFYFADRETEAQLEVPYAQVTGDQIKGSGKACLCGAWARKEQVPTFSEKATGPCLQEVCLAQFYIRRWDQTFTSDIMGLGLAALTGGTANSHIITNMTQSDQMASFPS